MKFRIVGADKETGEDVRMVIEAGDRTQAERWANDNNVLWTEISPQSVLSHAGNKLQKAHQAAALAQMSSDNIQPSHQPGYSTAAVSIPQAGAAFMHQTIVQPQKGASGFGIGALVLGIIAAVICWVPFLGLLSLPVAGIGLLLGIVGFLVSLVGRRSGVGMPVAGSFVCVLAIIVAVVSTGSTAKSIGDTMQASMQARNQTNQQVVSDTKQEVVAESPDQTDESASDGPTPAEGTTPAALAFAVSDPTSAAATKPMVTKPTIAPDLQPRKSPPHPPVEWVTSDKAVRQGDVEVRVVSWAVGKVALKSAFSFDDKQGSSADDLLTLKVQIKNLSDSKKVQYRTWAGERYSFERDSASIEDNFGNTYKRINFGMEQPIGRSESESIYPGKSVSDVLVFEPPIDKAEYLNVELPGKNFGGTGMLRIRVRKGD